MRLARVTSLVCFLLAAACGTAPENTPDGGDETSTDAGEQASGWTSACGDLKACGLTCTENATASTVCASLASNSLIPEPAGRFSFEGFVSTDATSSPCSGSSGMTGCGVVEGNVLFADGVYDRGATFGKTLTLGLPGQGGEEIPPGMVRADSTRPTTFTISAWVKPANNLGNRMVVNDGFDHGTQSGWALYVTPEGKFNAYIGGGSVPNSQAIEAGFACPGKWTHVAVSFAAKSIRIYVNGVFLDNKIVNFTDVVLGTPRFTIGKSTSSALPIGTFDGELDDVTLWSGAITDSEIKQVYETGFCRKSIR